MAAKARVPRHGQAGFVDLEAGATVGATLGLNLFNPDGSVALPADLAAVLAPFLSGTGGVPSEVYWKTLREVPVDIVALGNIATAGLYAITADGASATRTLQPTVGRTTVSNGDGVAGNPVIDLAVVPDAGGGTLQRFARDGYGRVTGTSAASTSDLAEGSNLYYTDERAQDALAAAFAAGTHVGLTVTYNDAAGSFSFTVTGGGGGPANTDALAEGTTNLYFTSERAQDAIAALLAAGTHTGVTVTYNDAGNSLSLSASGAPTAAIVASEALSAGDVVSVHNVSGSSRVRRANATDDTKLAHGFVLASVASGATATVALPGALLSGLSGLVPGARYFLATSAGAITATAPSTVGNVVHLLGIALDATTLLFTPDDAITITT